MKLLIRVILAIILIPILLLLTKCTAVHFDNDAGARHLLLRLQSVPLPPNSRLIYQGYKVGGGYFSATGDSTNYLAYSIFLADASPPEVSAFCKPFVRTPDDSETGVFPLLKPPYGPFLPMDVITAHIPQAEQSHAYVLYSLDWGPEDAFWDIRGW
jgi:hypothetical protein